MITFPLFNQILEFNMFAELTVNQLKGACLQFKGIMNVKVGNCSRGGH